MWLKLANAVFTNNLGTLSSLTNSYSITYNLTGGISKTTGATSIPKASGQNYVNLSENFVATFTLGTGAEYTSTSITVGGNALNSSYYSASESSGIVTVTIPTTSAQQITGNVIINVIATAGSAPVVTNYTFTINPTPSDATVTLTASGYTQNGNSITVANGTTVSWSVSASGYTEQTGTWTINGGNKTENITLTASSGSGETAQWEIYSQDGLSTVTTDENGIPTVTAGGVTKAAVLMKNTNNNFSFKAPVASSADGTRMVIFGRYGNEVIAFRVRGASTGTNLQRYNYTTFNGAVLSTNSAAVNTFAQGDTLKVVWSSNTASLYINNTLHSSFDCSSYMANDNWQKCAGFLFTNFSGISTTFTLSDFTLE